MSLLPLIIIKSEICSYNIHSSERLERVLIKFYLHEHRHKGCDQQQLWRRFRTSSHLALVKSAVYPEDIIAFQDRFRKLLYQRSYSFNRTAVLGVGYQGKYQAALIKYLIYHQAIVGTSLSFGSYPQIVSNHIACCSPTYFASYLSSHFVLMTTSLVAPFLSLFWTLCS